MRRRLHTRKKERKGVFFSVDALIAAMIILSGLTLISQYYVSEQKSVNLNYIATDLLNVLDSVTVAELNSSYANDLILAGTITNTNNTLLEQIGEFWANDELGMAYNFTLNITDGLISDSIGYGIWYDNETIYQETNPATFVVSAKKIMSGLEKAKPIKGFVSSARAVSVVKNTTLVVPFQQQGTGWDEGYAKVEKLFEMPAFLTIHNATFHVAVHTDTNDNDMQFQLNDLCNITRNDVTWRLNAEGGYGEINVTNCIVPGVNNATFSRLNNDYYNGHIHPGARLEIMYEIDETVDYSTDSTSQVSERVYFDRVMSHDEGWGVPGVFQLVPFHIPEDATDVEVGIHIQARSVRDYGTGGSCWSWGWWNRCFTDWSGGRRLMRDNDVIVFLNEADPFFTDANPASTAEYSFTPAETAADIRVGQTNSLIVYVNNYGDTSWGTGGGRAEIYSDWVNDPDGSSYVEMNYTIPSESHYGQILVSQTESFDGPDGVNVFADFSFPSQAQEMDEVFVNVAQQYSYLVRVRADDQVDPPVTNVFNSVAAREVPTTVMIPSDTISLSSNDVNYLEIRDMGGNTVLQESSVDYSFYVQSFVGFGDVFSTQDEAVTDALLRLNETLGPFVSLQSAEIANNSITDVPSMWGPAVIEVRAWH